MPDEIIQQREHRTYLRDIDELFSATSGSLAALLSAIQAKKPIHNMMFIPFYQGFVDLYLQTSKSKAMLQETELIKKIDTWMDQTNIDKDRIFAGRDLFRQWGQKMEHNGIHTFTK